MCNLLFILAKKMCIPKLQIVHKSPQKNGKARCNRTLANPPPPQILDPNFSKRVTRGKAKEVDQVIKRLENLHLYSDELDGEPKDKLASFALVVSDDLKPSCYENACTNDVWINSMEEKIHTIVKNDTWELFELPRGKRL